MNPTDEYDDHMNAIPTTMILMMNGKNCKNIIFINAARVSGNKQYPRTHTLWKKDIFPPRSCPFTATIAAPAQTITNTISKTNEPSSVFAEKLRQSDNQRQRTRGPHKSQSLSCLAFSLIKVLGTIT